MSKLAGDKVRYGTRRMPLFQIFLRKAQETRNPVLGLFYKGIYLLLRSKNHIEISWALEVGEGLYIGHPYGITINRDAKLGKNINIHKGATIGQENRGPRKGTPVIADQVYIGINSTIIGAIHVGTDVLIAPNTLVNCDVPDHSVVIGNPCIIKHRDNATEGYIDNMV